MITIDKYGEINMKLTDFALVTEWLSKHPEHEYLSVNEVAKLYMYEQNEISKENK